MRGCCKNDPMEQCTYDCDGCNIAIKHNYEPDPDEEYEKEREKQQKPMSL